MEANGFKQRLDKAKENKEFLKLLFQYPATDRVTVKRGHVIATFQDSFDFREIRDGDVAYSYRFLVEIVSEPEVEE